MSRSRQVDRVITMRGIGTPPEGNRMQVHRIQVRQGIPLPDLGQRVVAMDEHRIIKYAGEVIDVDFENHTYDVEVRPSMDSDAPTIYQVDQTHPAGPEIMEYGGRRVV